MEKKDTQIYPKKESVKFCKKGPWNPTYRKIQSQFKC